MTTNAGVGGKSGRLMAAILLAAGLVGCGTNATNNMALPDLSIAAKDCVAHPEECGGCQVDDDCVKQDPALPVCTHDHTCVACLPDKDNCAAGTVCQNMNNTWVCGVACTGNADCNKLGGGSLCCAPHCINPDNDVTNCGACGMVCPQPANGSAACSSGHCIIGSCNAGFDDCDKSPVNGCEAVISNDPNNCGKCANVCKPFSNGLPTCTNGMCAAICAPGYSDCDNNTANGCEADTTYDIAHCGGCGKICAAPANAAAFCDLSKCSFRCKLGYADCDGNAANGCEVSTGVDANHCGHCGNICPLRPNAMGAGCMNGQCTNSCNQGFGDCDNKPANGCEADLSNSLAACGACGKPCSNQNAIATCSKGMCSLQCNPGFIDCNTDGIDGCEVNPKTDPKNCGGCGQVCPQNTPYCNQGMCSMNFPGVLLGSINGQQYYKVQVMGVMSDNNVFMQCQMAGMKTPCQAMVCPSYNDVKCAPTQENSCGNPMLLLSQTICGGQSPPSCPALNNCFQYMGNLWNGGASCGALNGSWCTSGNAVMNGFAVCTP